MTQLKIVTYPDKSLKEPTKSVKNINGKLMEAVGNMGETMYLAPGIGLAAIQVGIDQSFLVYDVSPTDEKRHLNLLINPRIVEKEGEIISENEGCLSVPDYRADVKRYASILVEGYDENEKPVRIEAHELLSIVLQHEIDHLQGTLFIDHISALKRQIYKRKIKKQLKRGE